MAVANSQLPDNSEMGASAMLVFKIILPAMILSCRLTE
jgi:hypothetical protein